MFIRFVLISHYSPLIRDKLNNFLQAQSVLPMTVIGE